MIYALVYINWTTRAVRFIASYKTATAAELGMQAEVLAYYCAGPWRVEMGKRRAKVMCKDENGTEYLHGFMEILKH